MSTGWVARGTFYNALREMTDWLLTEQVAQVAMEVPGVYWRLVLQPWQRPAGRRSLCATPVTPPPD
jgi:hypothetical protein